jgi:hypothetical protein
MAVEDWIDDIADRWATIVDPKGGNLRSYRVFGTPEFPEAITDYPCALTYTSELTGVYASGESVEYWNGVTEFHLVGDSAKHHYPYIMRWFKLIRDASNGALQLGGKVSFFGLRAEGVSSIEGPVVLQYGSEEPHLGLIARWRVKEDITDEVTITA